MCLLPSGDILVAAPCWNEDSSAVRTFVAKSTDGGKTFSTIATLPYSDATPFVQNGVLYMFVQPKQWQDFSIIKSVDEGLTWSSPSLIFQGVYWNCHTGMVAQNGRLYWAMQTVVADWGQCSLAVVSGDLSADLSLPSSWRTLERSRASRDTEQSRRERRTSRKRALVGIHGRERQQRRCMARAQRGERRRQPSRDASHGARRIRNGRRGNRVRLRRRSERRHDDLHAILSMARRTKTKCFVLYDATSRLFWMLSNAPADSQGRIFDWQSVQASGHFLNGPGNDRRFLMLWYGVDAINWFPAGCVAQAAKLSQSFMYPVGAIDGDDLVLISRTSINGDSQHDADCVTFHRVAQFRSLAMNLFPAT